MTLGEFKELTAKGIPPTGTENYGGPVATAGGLLFIAATKDGMFRAFDKQTGRLLWENGAAGRRLRDPQHLRGGGQTIRRGLLRWQQAEHREGGQLRRLRPALSLGGSPPIACLTSFL